MAGESLRQAVVNSCESKVWENKMSPLSLLLDGPPSMWLDGPRFESSWLPVRQHKPNVDVEVTNFGPITNGKVEIRPLIVFAGPSNTGKSWLAILVYALWRAFSDGDQWSLPRRRKYLLSDHDFECGLKAAGLKFFPENPKEWSEAIQGNLEVYLNQREQEFLGFLAGTFESQVTR